MSLTPQSLLSTAARQRCVSKLKELPSLVVNDEKASESASVLVPLCVHKGQVCLLYTLRSSNLKNHRGQVSFPGGMADANETNIDTALRETEEEIGVTRDSVDIWGSMPQVQGRNKNLAINPIVGEIRNFDINKLHENPDEVEEIFLVPMQAFCDTNNHAHWMWKEMQLPMFLYGRHKIWGITGAITHMFLNCLLPEGATDSPLCRGCMEAEETASHVVLECSGVAPYRAKHLESPRDLPEALLNIKGRIPRGAGLAGLGLGKWVQVFELRKNVKEN